MSRRRTMREERRTYRRRNRTGDDGYQCRSRPARGKDRCLLHAEPAESEGA